MLLVLVLSSRYFSNTIASLGLLEDHTCKLVVIILFLKVQSPYRNDVAVVYTHICPDNHKVALVIDSISTRPANMVL